MRVKRRFHAKLAKVAKRTGTLSYLCLPVLVHGYSFPRRVVKLTKTIRENLEMYINFENSNMKGDLFSGEYRARFAVESVDGGLEGAIFFTNDRNGIGSLEWCRNGSGQGAGLRIALDELIRMLESAVSSQ